MNNLAFQIYGLKKTGIFQSTWDTTLVSALGGEQAAISATGTNWALNTGATNLNVGGYKHTAGSTTNLTTTLAAATMQMYQITYTISGRTAGSVTINYGGVSTSGLITSSSVNILATATTVFSITPTSDFDGVISISVKQTSSATNQIKLPLPNIGTYNIWVDWGDGTYNNITSYNSTSTLHTYPTSGTYTVRITGSVFVLLFSAGPTNDRLKLKTISSWGKIKFTNYSFFGCSNLTLSGITDVPDLSSVTNFQYLFGGCSKITTIGRINEWNTSSITSMGNVFDSCTLFNSNISNWNVSNVTNFSQMFINATSFNNGFASGDGVGNQLTWTINTTAAVSTTTMFNNATSFNSNLGTGTIPWNVSMVTNFSSMFAGAAKFNNGDESDVTLSKINDWSINTVTAVNMSSMFSSATIFNRNIGSWNVSKVTTFANMFALARDFNNGGSPSINNWSINTASPVPMNSMFYQAYSFNQPIENWNVTSVNTMQQMFSLALAFNQPLANWERSTPGNTSTLANVTNMYQMFCATIPGTAKFNQNIGNWNISGVTNFTQMFANLSNGVNPFNNDGSTSINSWQIKTNGDVNMTGMFTKSVFNQPLNLWNTSAVTNMSTMFQTTYNFDQDLSTWNVNKVTSFSSMFNNAQLFNNGSNLNTNPVTNRIGIDGWNINSTTATNMSSMFQSTPKFDRNISNWDMSRVSTTSSMFANTVAFDQPIGDLNITYVPDVSGMFSNAAKFNQPLANWERVGSTTSYITTMASMFAGARLFNQDISNWNVSGVTNFSSMFSSSWAFNNGLNTGTNLITGRTGIDGWNINTVSSVNMSEMFRGAGGDTYVVFDRPIGNWNTIKVNNMYYMFGKSGNGNHAFNQNIGDWDTGNVINMSYMFNAGQGDGTTSKFNQDISKWNVTKVTDFSYMLAAKQFNNGITVGQNTNPVSGLSGLNGWVINTTGTSVNMQYMFYRASTFNRDISEWNMTKVTNTGFMFNGATIFNQPLANWERIGSTLSGVTNMSTMFSGATAFQQYIGNWNISNVSNFTNFMSTKTTTTFPTQYLDDIYTGWSALPSVKPSISISFNTAASTPAPSTAATAKAKLKATPNNWIIVEATNP